MSFSNTFLRASGAPAWYLCPAKPWRELEYPEDTSPAAAEGTLAHEMRRHFLDYGTWPDTSEKARDMRKFLETSINFLKSFEKVFPEKELDISYEVAERGATGTADAIITDGDTLIVEDLKYGFLPIDAESEQLIIYAHAALRYFEEDFQDKVIAGVNVFKKVRLIISQPRLGRVDEKIFTVEEIINRTENIRSVAKEIHANSSSTPVAGEIQCRYCRAKADCEAFKRYSLDKVFEDFKEEDLKKGELIVPIISAEKIIAAAYGVSLKNISFQNEKFILKKPSIVPAVLKSIEKIPLKKDEELATILEAVPMIKSFCEVVKEEVEKRLKSRDFSDKRFKLVKSRGGNRTFIDPENVEKILKEIGFEDSEIFEKKLKTPAQFEKLLGENFKILQEKVVRSEGALIVAPASDFREDVDNIDIFFEEFRN